MVVSRIGEKRDKSSDSTVIIDASTPTEATPLRLKGILKLVSSQCRDQQLQVFQHDPQSLAESQTLMTNRRRVTKRSIPPSQHLTFEQLVQRHRYVAFFFIQGNSSNYFSPHCLLLRNRLAQGYHDVMTTFVMPLSDDTEDPDFLFCQGTGFAVLPPSSVVLSMLNITQVPYLAVLETATGQRKDSDAMLAMEWNDPHAVINMWQRGKSGLSCTQKILAVASCQSQCVIS